MSEPSPQGHKAGTSWLEGWDDCPLESKSTTKTESVQLRKEVET